MGLPQRHHATGFTHAGFLTWPQGERWELVDGQTCTMSPAPSNFHQLIVGGKSAVTKTPGLLRTTIHTG